MIGSFEFVVEMGGAGWRGKGEEMREDSQRYDAKHIGSMEQIVGLEDGPGMDIQRKPRVAPVVMRLHVREAWNQAAQQLIRCDGA